MRIAIVGAGGVGGLLAGLLSRAGHDVALLARGPTLEAITTRGLRVESPLGAFTTRIAAFGSPGDLPVVDAVLLAVKGWQLPEVLTSIAPWVPPDALVVPLQNGVDAPDQCVAALGASRVVGGLCHMLSWIAEPGVIRHVGEAPRVTLGAFRTPLDARIEPLKDALQSAGVHVHVAADYRAALWEKFLFIASFGGTGALARSTAGPLRTIPETRRLLRRALEEVQALAVAQSIACAPDVVAKTLARIDALPESATASLQRDIVAGRPSELDSLSGAVARIGEALGVPVPIHQTIHAALLPLEHEARRRSQ
jgi:2-dehydropantoate 2-reductase